MIFSPFFISMNWAAMAALYAMSMPRAPNAVFSIQVALLLVPVRRLVDRVHRDVHDRPPEPCLSKISTPVARTAFCAFSKGNLGGWTRGTLYPTIDASMFALRSKPTVIR